MGERAVETLMLAIICAGKSFFVPVFELSGWRGQSGCLHGHDQQELSTGLPSALHMASTFKSSFYLLPYLTGIKNTSFH